MAAPTFVNEFNSEAWNSATSPKTLGTLSVLAGDAIVDGYGNENANFSSAGLAPPTGGSLTWTEHQDVGSSGSAARSCIASATVDVDKSMNVVSTNTVSGFWGHNALLFRNHGGIGNSAGNFESVAGAFTISLTTTVANSAIVIMVADWAAIDPATYTWAQVNGAGPTLLSSFTNGSNWGAAFGYYPDCGAAGAKTIGVTAPSTVQLAITAVEVKGVATTALSPFAPRRMPLGA